jgi:hypothetical protein
VSEDSHLKVVDFPKSTARDPAACLRDLADAIEAGSYGEVASLAVVLFGETLEVFSAGDDSAGPTTALLLNAGALRIAREIEEHGRE